MESITLIGGLNLVIFIKPASIDDGNVTLSSFGGNTVVLYLKLGVKKVFTLLLD